MPTITIPYEELCNLIDREVSKDEIRDVLAVVKGELEMINEDELQVEIKDSNRMDLFSIEGIAHVLRGFFGVEKGSKSYKHADPSVELFVDPEVQQIRPYIVAGIVRGVELSDDVVRRLMDFQEVIHRTHGQKRRRAAIGLYELDRIRHPIYYAMTSPDQNSYVPLGFEKEMTPREILEKHPKGKEFGHIIAGERYPIIIDDKGDVLSIPPIINSERLGHVDKDTRNIFMEVTGTDFLTISNVLNVLSMTIYEHGNMIESVELVYPDKTCRTPDLSQRELLLDPNYCNRLLGLSLGEREIVDLLAKARFDASISREKIKVRVPYFRSDILHQVDLIEEVGAMHGYDGMEAEIPETYTIGKADELEERSDELRNLLIGLGFQEIMTFVLTNPKNLFEKMRLKEREAAKIENPMLETYTCFRTWLIPSLMDFLSRNLHVEYPQRIFEVGDIVKIAPEEETGTRTERRAALAWADSKLNFTQMKSVVEAVLNNLSVSYRLEESNHPSFIEGRCAIIKGAEDFGIFGEIHPEVLENWGLSLPTLAFEMQV